jgi:hypothetical protein
MTCRMTLLVLTAATLVATSIGAAALPQRPPNSSKPSTHFGFTVTGDHRGLPVLSTGWLTMARNGDEQVVALSHNKADRRIEYLTREPDEARWSAHRVANTVTVRRLTTVYGALSPSGKKLITAIYKCHRSATWLSETRIARHTALRPPRLALSSGMYCGSSGALQLSAQPVGLPHNRAAVLLVRYRTTGAPSAPLVSIGRPGAKFPAPTALPNPHGFVATSASITRDHTTGQLFVCANDNNGRVLVWAKPPGSAWSASTMITPASGGIRYGVGDVSAADGKVFVVLTRGRDPLQRLSDAVAIRKSTGRWTAPRPIPHTGDSHSVVAAANQRTGRFHVVFSTGPAAQSDADLAQEALVGGKWRYYRQLVQSQGELTPLDVVITPAGQPVVAYRRV